MQMHAVLLSSYFLGNLRVTTLTRLIIHYLIVISMKQYYVYTRLLVHLIADKLVGEPGEQALYIGSP